MEAMALNSSVRSAVIYADLSPRSFFMDSTAANGVGDL